MLKPHLEKVLTGNHLSMNEASEALNIIMDGQATSAQIAGLLIALKQKGETAEEIGKRILQAVGDFTGQTKRADDMTLIILHV